MRAQGITSITSQGILLAMTGMAPLRHQHVTPDISCTPVTTVPVHWGQLLPHPWQPVTELVPMAVMLCATPDTGKDVQALTSSSMARMKSTTAALSMLAAIVPLVLPRYTAAWATASRPEHTQHMSWPFVADHSPGLTVLCFLLHAAVHNHMFSLSREAPGDPKCSSWRGGGKPRPG